MTETFADMLAEGGKKNSLGRVNEVIEIVLADKSRLEELYQTIFDDDSWVRMRAIDAFEKICRVHPEWITPYIDKIQQELSASSQASIQWHIAEIYTQVELSSDQKEKAITWLKNLLGNKDSDWIAVSNAMETLAFFVRSGDPSRADLVNVLRVQLNHKSKAVTKRAQKLLAEFS